MVRLKGIKVMVQRQWFDEPQLVFMAAATSHMNITYVPTSLNKVLSSFLYIELDDICLVSRDPLKAVSLRQLAAKFASLHQSEEWSLSAPRPSVTPLALSLLENSRMADGIGRNAGRFHRAALICQARNKK